MDHSDQHLIDQFRETGQVEFLEELLQRHLCSIRQAVFQMVLDHDVADDVTQTVFLKVVRGIERFEGRAEFSTWLFRIAINTARSSLRKEARSRVQFYGELPETSAMSGCAPDGAVMQTELTAEIQAALCRLSPQLRAALMLVCLQGKTSQEAAEIEGCSVDTIYWRVHQARRQLKKLLAEHL